MTAVGTGTRRWAVVGGGMLGMTLAHRLAQRGADVTVIEADDHLGGLAAPWRLGDVTWDRHYHVTLLSDRRLRGLLAELGLEDGMRWVETQTGFYDRGRLSPVSNTVDFLRLPVLGLLDKARLAATILYGSKVRQWERLEQVPVADWLTRWSGRRTFERFWQPLLRAKLGDGYTDASAAFIWTTIQRLYAARRTGLKKELFGYVPGGYARILDRFAEVLGTEGVTVELGRPVRAVAAAAGGVPGGGVAVTGADGRADTFDEVVVTVAAPLAARICHGLNADEQARLQGVRYLGIVSASVLMRQPLGPYYLTYVTDPDTPVTGVVEMTAFVDPAELGGHALVYLPKYVPPDSPLFAASDEEVRASFLGFLGRMYPAFAVDDVLAFQVSRVRQVFALPTIGYSRRVPPVTTSVPGLHLVSSAHIVNGTLNVDETLGVADQALATITAGARTREVVAP